MKPRNDAALIAWEWRNTLNMSPMKKQQCDTCNCKNSRVQVYKVFNKEIKLCEACVKIAMKMKEKETKCPNKP